MLSAKVPLLYQTINTYLSVFERQKKGNVLNRFQENHPVFIDTV